MTLRRRLTLAAAIAVAVAAVAVSAAAYLVVRGQLMDQIDQQLTDQLLMPPPGGRIFRRGFGRLPADRGGPTPYIQAIDQQGDVVRLLGSEEVALPVTARARDVAAGNGGQYIADLRFEGGRVRVLTTPVDGGAVQIGRPLSGVDSVLRRLRLILLFVCLAGIALAVFLGRLVSRNVVAPIVHVTEAARHIAATEDLGRRIQIESADEVGELAQHFNAMLDTLEGSIAAQRQLVADASHELRTPITSLRTNIEVLADAESLPAAERAQLLEDIDEQTQELGMLVTDLIELARGDTPRRDTEDVRLDELVREAITRAHRHAPAIHFESRLEPAVVEGTRDRLARAVNNLLDNAATHSPPGGVVEVDAGPFGVRVRDHGPGISGDDLPHLFDRFYRGASARSRPGSGLGLAIVRQVAEQHGGDVRAGNAPGGGAEFVLTLPATAPAESGRLWGVSS